MDYEFIPNIKDEAMIRNFCDYMNGNYTVSVRFLYEYMSFQFERWVGINTKFGKGAIMLNWIIGKKAISEFLYKTEHRKDYSSNISKIGGVSYADFIKETGFEMPYKGNSWMNSREYVLMEEEVRSRYFNTDVGFKLCLDYTLLYYNNSKYCPECIFKMECKSIQESAYGNIFRCCGRILV